MVSLRAKLLSHDSQIFTLFFSGFIVLPCVFVLLSCRALQFCLSVLLSCFRLLSFLVLSSLIITSYFIAWSDLTGAFFLLFRHLVLFCRSCPDVSAYCLILLLRLSCPVLLSWFVKFYRLIFLVLSSFNFFLFCLIALVCLTVFRFCLIFFSQPRRGIVLFSFQVSESVNNSSQKEQQQQRRRISFKKEEAEKEKKKKTGKETEDWKLSSSLKRAHTRGHRVL